MEWAQRWVGGVCAPSLFGALYVSLLTTEEARRLKLPLFGSGATSATDRDGTSESTEVLLSRDNVGGVPQFALHAGAPAYSGNRAEPVSLGLTARAFAGMQRDAARLLGLRLIE